MTDEQRLATSLAADLDGHFEALVRAFQDRLFGFALRLLGSPADAEEAIQDTFVRAYRALQKYPSERVATLRLKAWLYQIALNVVRNRVRRPALVAVSVDAADAVAGELAEQPESRVLSVESRHELATLVRELPPRYATAVVLRHVQGLSYVEAAQILDQPVGTTKSDVHRGLRLLREALKEER